MIDGVVRAVLDRYPARERPRAAPTPLGGAGGLSGSRLWRFEAAEGPRVLRAWPEAVSLARVERIHGWLVGADLSFVARPIRAIDGSTTISTAGRCWELTPWLAGGPDLGRPPSEKHVRAAFEGLAALHVRLGLREARHGPSPGLIRHREELRTLVDGGFSAIGEAVSAHPDDPCAAAATTWLGLAERVAPAVLTNTAQACSSDYHIQPCLRDARPEHFLFVGEVFVGLIDFGAMDVETVGADLARLMGEWLPGHDGDELRAEGLAAYGRIRPLEPAELDAARAFERLADVLIAERWVRWRFLERRTFAEESSFAEGIERGLTRLRRLAGE